MSTQRAKGAGSIAERGPNTWQLHYYVLDPATGKKKQKTETFHGSRSKAEKLMRDRQKELEQGKYVAPIKQTLDDYLIWWLANYGATHTTQRTMMGYRGIVGRYLSPKLGKRQIQSIMPEHVRELHTWMQIEKGLSPRTVTHAHRVLSEALDHAVNDGKLPFNPGKKVSPPKSRAEEVGIPNDDAVARFFSAAKDSQFYDAFLMALYTGLRRSELCGLRWEGVDLEKGVLRVTGTLQRITGKGLVYGPPKSKTSRRSVDLDQNAIDVLHRVRGKQLALQVEMGPLYSNPMGLVFLDDMGRLIDADRLGEEFRKAAQKAGVSNLTLHTLRHLQASQIIADGGSVKLVAERLGHANAAITLNVYSHLLPGLQKQAAEALGKKFAKLTGEV